jgi:hypothetical protein
MSDANERKRERTAQWLIGRVTVSGCGIPSAGI